MKSDFFKVYLPIVFLVVAAFYVTFQFVEPPPPDTVRIAGGSSGGAYNSFASDYAAKLADEDVVLDIMETSGSVENLELLLKGAADVAFVQGGVGVPEEMPALVGLASLYHEPLWIFAAKGDAPITRLDLTGKTVAIGGVGSGTHALAKEILETNGQIKDVNIEQFGGKKAAKALRNGEVDYALFVAGVRSPVVLELLADPQFELVGISRAEAYSRQLRHLSPIELPEGSLDLTLNIPSRDVRLLAPAATLVAREDLHPALVNLLMQAAEEVHEKGDVLTEPGHFPSDERVEFPLSDEAKRFHKSGPPFLQRYLPFWIANLIDRLWILVIPLLTILIPLMRVAPPIYRWRVRRKIYRWYRNLREIETQVRLADLGDDLGEQQTRLEALQVEVGQIDVPLAYSEYLYHLRLHIKFVMDQLHQREASDGSSPRT
ncbi:MAG: TAXI family TRAP transporter solute-binding subunit [Pseudomonadota bacterium]